MVEEKPIEELTFREAMAELDRIVGVLESNSLELEQSVTSYERGVKLIASLKKRIDGAQQRIDVLMGELEKRRTTRSATRRCPRRERRFSANKPWDYHRPSATLRERRLAFPCEKKPACPLFVSNEQRNRLPNSNGSHVRCLRRMLQFTKRNVVGGWLLNVLVINAGSSSLKYQLVHVENHAVIAKGICERVGSANAFHKHGIDENEVVIDAQMADHDAAMALVLNSLINSDDAPSIPRRNRCDRASHRPGRQVLRQVGPHRR